MKCKIYEIFTENMKTLYLLIYHILINNPFTVRFTVPAQRPNRKKSKDIISYKRLIHETTFIKTHSPTLLVSQINYTTSVIAALLLLLLIYIKLS